MNYDQVRVIEIAIYLPQIYVAFLYTKQKFWGEMCIQVQLLDKQQNFNACINSWNRHCARFEILAAMNMQINPSQTKRRPLY
jgi:hypothetical protein